LSNKFAILTLVSFNRHDVKHLVAAVAKAHLCGSWPKGQGTPPASAVEVFV